MTPEEQKLRNQKSGDSYVCFRKTMELRNGKKENQDKEECEK